MMHDMIAGRAAGTALYEACALQFSGETNAILLCIVQGLEEGRVSRSSFLTSFLLVLCGALVFMMQIGFAALCAGCVRRKNVSNTLLKNLLDACVTAVAFYAVGFAFAFGGDNPLNGLTFVGTQNFFLTGDVDMAVWFFQYTFSAAAVTIIAGTLAERSRMSAYIAYSCFISAFVYPVVAHSIWSSNGFLSHLALKEYRLLGTGSIDFAGSGVIHLTGGTTALVSTWILGPRKGRFTNSKGEELEKPREIPGHSVSLQVLGAFLLWFGWYGFNCGSSLLVPGEQKGLVAGLAAVNTSLSGALGAITALLTNLRISKSALGESSLDLPKALNGALAGLVAITAGCGVVEPWAACLIGVFAGWIYLGASYLLLTWRLDDAVDGIPIHMFNGIWGLLATGLFASPERLITAYGSGDHPGFFYSLTQPGSVDATLLACQTIAVLFILGWTVGLMLPFFTALNVLGWLRVDAIEEIAGLDASYQHAKQEDHEQLKESIMQEFREHKESLSENKTRRITRNSTCSTSMQSEIDIGRKGSRHSTCSSVLSGNSELDGGRNRSRHSTCSSIMSGDSEDV